MRSKFWVDRVEGAKVAHHQYGEIKDIYHCNQAALLIDYTEVRSFYIDCNEDLSRFKCLAIHLRRLHEDLGVYAVSFVSGYGNL